jgi:hypothetical protein
MRRIIQIDAAQAVLIDALQGETFAIQLGTSISNLQIENVSPGQLYVFILTQDHVGGHTVAWGSEVLNAVSANPDPNSTTILCCIGTTGGILEANIPGTTWP